jgi:undecaprenyl-diphosphatase
MMSWLQQLDTDLFLFLNGLHNPWLDPVMAAISGKLIWIPLYAASLFLMVWKFKAKSWLWIVAAILLVALTDLASVHLFKNVFLRLRPCHEPGLQELVHLVNGRCGGSYGFVSSHAANTFGFATLMTLIFRKQFKWLGWTFFAWAACVSYSRIYLGVHYPGDIIAGAMLGMLLGWIVWKGVVISSPTLSR